MLHEALGLATVAACWLLVAPIQLDKRHGLLAGADHLSSDAALAKATPLGTAYASKGEYLDERQVQTMNVLESEPGPYTIVVGVDFSEVSNLALERGLDLAAARRPAHLNVVFVQTAWTSRSEQPPNAVESQDDTPPKDMAQTATRLHEHVEWSVRNWCEAHASEPPFERLTTHVRFDPAAEALAQLALDIDAHVIIVGTNGRRGARRFLLGSVAEGTIRLAPCDVLVVRPPDATIPTIEPPCPDCVETRRTTHGDELWCERHRNNGERQFTMRSRPGKGAHQSGFLLHPE